MVIESLPENNGLLALQFVALLRVCRRWAGGRGNGYRADRRRRLIAGKRKCECCHHWNYGFGARTKRSSKSAKQPQPGSERAG